MPPPEIVIADALANCSHRDVERTQTAIERAVELYNAVEEAGPSGDVAIEVEAAVILGDAFRDRRCLPVGLIPLVRSDGSAKADGQSCVYVDGVPDGIRYC